VLAVGAQHPDRVAARDVHDHDRGRAELLHELDLAHMRGGIGRDQPHRLELDAGHLGALRSDLGRSAIGSV
jgi:hypothetical protein